MRRRPRSSLSRTLSTMRTVTNAALILLIVLFVMLSPFGRETQSIEAYPVKPLPHPVSNLDDYIAIRVDRFGDIYVNRRPTVMNAVRANIERWRAKTSKANVLIRVEAATANGLIVAVARQAALAQVETVDIVLVPPPPDPYSRHKGRSTVW